MLGEGFRANMINALIHPNKCAHCFNKYYGDAVNYNTRYVLKPEANVSEMSTKWACMMFKSRPASIVKGVGFSTKENCCREGNGGTHVTLAGAND
jgi:hypothetical protein